MRQYSFGEVWFKEVEGNFVSLHIRPTHSFPFVLILQELGLIRPEKRGRRSTYVWEDEFKEFLAEHNYTDTSKIMTALRGTNGLLLRNDRAIMLKMRFL